MLTKTTRDVFVPSKPALPYRPYSKTCPAPTPPTHWQNKVVCGTVSAYAFIAFNNTGQPITVVETIIALPGFPDSVAYSSSWNSGLPVTAPALVSQQPYCTTVQVFE